MHTLSQRDFDRVSRAIAFIRAHRREQPGLEAIAASVHLSPHHFQRLFSRWTGVSPKQFLATLTLDDAKRRLRDGGRLLDTALETGLSGSGRLHDLFVRLEAMSPGDYQRLGSTMSFRHATADTPFGPALVVETERGICALEFIGEAGPAGALERIRERWPLGRFEADTGDLTARVEAAFAGAADRGLPVLVRGNDLQVQVWRALLRIPEGTIVAYGDLARGLGYPGAARAVGSAIAANTVGWLIPCHRVLRADGVVGEYRWGTDRKAAMVAWEAGKV